MARIRSIKPEFAVDQTLAKLPRDVRLFYILLWPHADEECRMQADPRLLKSWCFPLDDDVTPTVIDEWVETLVAAGKVVRYEVDGSLYLWITNMAKHQKLDPRLFSKLPPPPEVKPQVRGTTEVNTDQSVRTGVENTDAHPPEVAKQVAGSRWQVAGGREAPPTEVAVRLVDHHAQQCQSPPTSATLKALTAKVNGYLDDGCTETAITGGLKRMRAKGLGLSFLDELVSEAGSVTPTSIPAPLHIVMAEQDRLAGQEASA